MFAWGRQLTPNGGESVAIMISSQTASLAAAMTVPHSGGLEDGPITLTSGVSAAPRRTFLLELGIGGGGNGVAS